jgi:hypothetical protein
MRHFRYVALTLLAAMFRTVVRSSGDCDDFEQLVRKTHLRDVRLAGEAVTRRIIHTSSKP